jgi:thymidylate synthase
MNQLDFLKWPEKPVLIDNKLYLEIINADLQFSFNEVQDLIKFEHYEEAKLVMRGIETERYTQNYADSIDNNIDFAYGQLIDDIHSRRSIIKISPNSINQDACLNHMQFLIRDNELNVIASLRSSEAKTFLLFDLALIYYTTERIFKVLQMFYNLKLGYIYLQIGSLHIPYDETTFSE